MKKREYRDYLHDIFSSIDDIASFIADMTYENFLKDRKTSHAVIRSIEIIGEAAKHLPKSLKDKYPAVAWKRMAGMRDKVIHEYFGVNYEIVWKTAIKDIPALKKGLSQVMKQENLE
jgi:uncharacterized protein with HEPN domain